jgi:hypothetical protein
VLAHVPLGVSLPLTIYKFEFGFVYVSCAGIHWAKGGISKIKRSSPNKRTCQCREKRRDLRRDVMKRRLREDLMEISQD